MFPAIAICFGFFDLPISANKVNISDIPLRIAPNQFLSW